ncbi:Hypothetical predicted protein [Octopus vulgaris]|uniref:Uncharacterized protein n=1 Tax=Octopus vulgaris TaxID=6645 RepID=A0AA36B4J7_OCTVU|nr:Hypothetical predicted protein [Octopus vulgaris]
MENEHHKIPWDFNIQCGQVIEVRRLDIVLIFKDEKEAKNHLVGVVVVVIVVIIIINTIGSSVVVVVAAVVVAAVVAVLAAVGATAVVGGGGLVVAQCEGNVEVQEAQPAIFGWKFNVELNIQGQAVKDAVDPDRRVPGFSEDEGITDRSAV